MTPRVVVVGLGPGGPDLVTAGTLDAIAATPHRYLRTRRHPSASVLGDGAISFDGHYESAASFDEVYAAIVDDLVAAATEHGTVLYAVPGSPRVAEHSVTRLCEDGRVAVEVLPALSFLDLAWARLGVDPVATGVALIDGRRFAVEAAGRTGALLVGQCDARHVLSDIKLALDEPPGEPVVVIHHLGLPDEAIYEVAWEDLDRAVEPDHLTSLYVTGVGTPVGAAFVAFDELVRRLRDDCPWDAEQTHASLRRHLLEEAYEVIEAIDAVTDDPDAGYPHLEEELGDLLYQVFFHAVLATEAGQFTVADVARGINDKLVHRHPHVFGDVAAADADAVLANWEQIKKAEKGRASVMDGIPAALPALLHALKVQKKAAGEGFAPVDGDEVAQRLAEVRTLLGRDPATVAPEDAEASVGALLFSVVALARRSGADPEAALRHATARFRSEFEARPGA